MHKLKVTYILIFLIATIMGCSNNEKISVKNVDAILKPLDNNNQRIIDSLGFESVFIYDVEIKNENVKTVHYWIEHYKNGQKQENVAGGATGFSKNKATIATSQTNFKLDEDNWYSRWNISIIDDGSISSFESLPKKMENPQIAQAKTWIDEDTTLEAEKPFTVALIIKDDSNGIAIGLDEELIQQTINQSDELFIVKAMISEKEEF
ncbi:hypothetical protein ACLM5H_01970 [Fredinandcohnia humi]